MRIKRNPLASTDGQTSLGLMNWAVIFDWDGVVIDSSSAHERSWELLAKEIGKPLPADHMKRGFGKKNAIIIPDILGWTGVEAEIRELSDRKEALYRRLLARGQAKTLPGAVELLRCLSAAMVPAVVGSSTVRANIEQAIKQFHLGSLFRDIASAEDCDAGKPNPDIFLVAADKAGVSPESCVVIEDAPHGIEAAHRAGMKAIGLMTSHPKSVMKEADLIISDLRQIGIADVFALLDSSQEKEGRDER